MLWDNINMDLEREKPKSITTAKVPRRSFLTGVAAGIGAAFLPRSARAQEAPLPPIDTTEPGVGGVMAEVKEVGETMPEVNLAGLKLEYKSDGRKYLVVNAPDADYGFKPPTQEGANALDEKLDPLGKTLSVIPNEELTTVVYGDFIIDTSDPMAGNSKKFIIMHPTVNPDDPNNFQLQYNKVAPEGVKIDPEYLDEINQPNILHATLGGVVARLTYDVANLWDIEDKATFDKANSLAGDFSRIRPHALELVVS